MNRHSVHTLFRIGTIAKFANGALEVLGGILLWLIPLSTLNQIIGTVLTNELLEDPNDLFANGVLHVFRGFSPSVQSFAVFYLLLHGLVKIGLVIALWRGKLWAYPLALITLGLFTIYQLYLFVHLHSVFQLVLAIIDMLIMLFIWLEYAKVKK